LVTANSIGALVLDVSSGRNLFNLDKDNSLAVAISPDGTRFALGGVNSVVQIYDLKSGALALEIKQHAAKINDLAFSPDGKLLASASSDRTVRFFETGKGTEVQNLRVHFEDAWSVAFSPDEKFIASAGTDFNAFLFDAAQITESSSFGIPAGVSGWSVISPDGKMMATSHFANPGETTIFDIETKSPKLVFSNEETYAGAFSPDGSRRTKRFRPTSAL
jgi:WD40 repeat protein